MTTTTDTRRVLAARLISWLETGDEAPGLFTADVFTDLTIPLGRFQAAGVADSIALRRMGHPSAGSVPRSRLDLTESGFVLEVEETWRAGGDDWYCRELIRCDVTDGAISEISVYCTGDWDSARVAEHRASVQLIRP
jgi:putative intracellular protease/amidase